MFDLNGATDGTWKATANQITIQFGDTTYTGTRNGSSFYGTATCAGTTWNWNVQFQGTNANVPARAENVAKNPENPDADAESCSGCGGHLTTRTRTT